jgi:long-chain fatty acid transport protein
MTFSGNDQQNFIIPEFGVNKMLTPDLSVGLSLYGNGGLNTGYSSLNSGTRGAQCQNPLVLQQFGGNAQACMSSPAGQLGAFGVGPMGVDLQQLFIAPTVAYKINPDNAIGVSLNIVHQSFRANGLQAFAGLSTNPASFSNPGHSSSNGVGVRIGWIGQVTPTLSLGATYQPKTHMGKFSAYSGLFSNGGQFDIPANYGVGFAWKATPALTVAGDVVRIDYGDVPAISNSSDCAFMGTCQLGSSNGGGFGWQSITVYKIGAAYQVDQALTLRAGWNHGDQPIPSSQALVNVIAPGVVQDHLTLGATYAISRDMEVSFDYAHAFKKTVTGTGLSQGVAISMSQNVLGVSLGWKY